MKMPDPLRANIIAGIPALIDCAIETATGKTEPFRSITIARAFSKPGMTLDLDRLVERMWMQLESNWVRAGSECRSERNWRWELKPYIHPDNKSPEKRLEKALAAVLPKSEWANQVPTASGLSASGDSHRNIDLAHWDGADIITIIELKTLRPKKNGGYACDTPIHAAFEIVVNALLLCLAREKPQIRKNIADDSPWLRENLTVRLRVLAPRELYREDQLDLGDFERVLGNVIAAFGEKHQVKMCFKFRVFDPTDVLLKSFEETHVYTN